MKSQEEGQRFSAIMRGSKRNIRWKMVARKSRAPPVGGGKILFSKLRMKDTMIWGIFRPEVKQWGGEGRRGSHYEFFNVKVLGAGSH